VQHKWVFPGFIKRIVEIKHAITGGSVRTDRALDAVHNKYRTAALDRNKTEPKRSSRLTLLDASNEAYLICTEARDAHKTNVRNTVRGRPNARLIIVPDASDAVLTNAHLAGNAWRDSFARLRRSRVHPG
jgi:hypothetical protein